VTVTQNRLLPARLIFCSSASISFTLFGCFAAMFRVSPESSDRS
jgi:hypothetical protein